MSDTITTKLVEQTLSFLEQTFRDELVTTDLGLAWVIHTVISLLFIIPALSVLARWLRSAFGAEARQEVLVCGHCREEVHERCVRCPSCEMVFPSSFLRAAMTLGALALAYWTAQQRGNPALFWSLVSVYGVLASAVGLFVGLERVREWGPAQAAHKLFGRCVEATIKGRELWARGEAALRVLIVVLFYGSLLLGLHRYGLPVAESKAGLSEVLDKLTFLFVLLSFTSLAVLIAQLRRFQGFATFVLALCSLLGFTLGAVVSHGLASFMVVKPIASPDNLVLSAFRQADGKIALRYPNAEGRPVRALATVGDPEYLRFSTSLLVVKRFSYRRYFVDKVEATRIVGPSLGRPLDRAEAMTWWTMLWDPPTFIYHFYALASAPAPPDWIKSLEAAVDPQEPRRWRIPLKQGQEIQVFVEGVRIFYRVKGTDEVKELERY